MRPSSATVRAALAGALVFGTACGASEGSPRPPNVLVVFGDEWRGMDLGCMGNPDVKTPNLDRLAAEGALFREAFANVPLCGPSRAMMLTGTYPMRNGILTNNMAIADDAETLPRILNEAGYRCGYVGKWHLGGFPEFRFIPPGPERAGFDDFWAVWGRSHHYFDSWYTTDTEEKLPSEGYAPDRQTDVAVEYLERRAAAGEPFALFVSYAPPHPPYEVPGGFLDDYEPDALHRRANVQPVERDGFGEERFRADLARYYAACSALDANVGRLLDALERLDLERDTVVVFTSDHGGLFSEHGLYGKQQPFEESVRVPMIVRYPARVSGGVEPDVLFSLADLAPTLLGLAGQDVPAAMQGVDLSWSATGGEGTAPESVYLQELAGIGRMVDHDVYTWRAVRTARHLYAEDMEGAWLLYDLERDPYQLENLVESPEYEDERAELAGELRGWYERLDEEYVPPAEALKRAGRAEFLDLIDLVGERSTNPAAQKQREFLEEGGTRGNREF